MFVSSMNKVPLPDHLLAEGCGKFNLPAPRPKVDRTAAPYTYYFCPIVFQGEHHVVTPTRALAKLIEKSDGIEFEEIIRAKSNYENFNMNLDQSGFHFESYSTCGYVINHIICLASFAELDLRSKIKL